MSLFVICDAVLEGTLPLALHRREGEEEQFFGRCDCVDQDGYLHRREQQLDDFSIDILQLTYNIYCKI